MAGLSSPGIGSGLDINGLITKLMDVEKAPITALDKKEADYQAKLTAYGTLKGAFASFQTAAQGLSSSSKFGTATATAADATILAANTSSIAKPGSYSIEVTKLAQSHKIASTGFADPTSAVGTGTLTIDFGTYTSGTPGSFAVNADKTATSITIDSSNNSLAGIRDAINQADAGVTASILNDGDSSNPNYRLVLSSAESGSANSLRVLVSNDGGAVNTDTSAVVNTDTTGLSKLAYNPTKAAGTGKNLEENVPAQNAELTIDGIAVSKSSNSIGDAITGVTLNLLKASALNTPTILTVARDTSNVKTAVEGFVKAFNDLAATTKDLGGYDFKTQKGGLLLGDSTLRGVQAQVRNIISQHLDYADGGVASLSDVGVSFQRDGTLAINASKLDAVLADSTKNVAGLFATLGVPTDSLISYGSSSTYTQAGRYGVDITTIATRGTATGSWPVGSTTITSLNNGLTLSLNGASASVELTTGSYTPDQLSAELQSKINSDTSFKSLGYKVSAAQSGGSITLTSTLYGSSSKVIVTGGSAASLLFGSTTSVTGEDVAGEIGGVAGTGVGQILTGSGDASGLQLLIEGGNTGARGTVSFSRGIAWQLDQTLTAMLGSDGSFASRTGGIDSSIKDIGNRRDVLNKRMVDIEARYRKQFNALDQLIASMQQTSSYLTQQLSSLSGTSTSK
jgi:flagellar hook-associated protein 2